MPVSLMLVAVSDEQLARPDRLVILKRQSGRPRNFLSSVSKFFDLEIPLRAELRHRELPGATLRALRCGCRC